MYENYKKLLDIKTRCGHEMFVMACSYIIDKGYDTVSKIEESDIERVKGNGLMTKEFCQKLVRTSKEITDAVTNGIEIIQFIATEDIFDLKYFSGKLSREKLENMVVERIEKENVSLSSEEGVKELCSLYNCDTDELELLFPDAAGRFEC